MATHQIDYYSDEEMKVMKWNGTNTVQLADIMEKKYKKEVEERDNEIDRLKLKVFYLFSLQIE